MPLGLRTWMNPKNHVLYGGPDPPWEGAILNGKRWQTVNYRDTMAICATMAEPTEMPFGLWTRCLGWAQGVIITWGPDSPMERGNSVPEENFSTLRCKGRLTEANTPTIRLDATASELTSAHLHPIFTGWMPFLPPNQQCQSTEGVYFCIHWPYIS